MAQMNALTKVILLAIITAANVEEIRLDPFGGKLTTTTEVLPNPSNVALMARYVVHNSNWTSVSYISHENDTTGLPLLGLFSVSDGPQTRGTGVPYFYVSRLQSAVTDLMDNDNHCSIMMSLAQSSICSERNLDPEDPRCAHVVMTGTFEKLNITSDEYDTAEIAIFTRHPSFSHLPKSHNFFLAKFNIQRILLQDRFGGPSIVPVYDYFHAYDKPSGPVKLKATSSGVMNNLAIFNLLLGIVKLFL